MVDLYLECVDQDPEKRPSAQALVQRLEQMCSLRQRRSTKGTAGGASAILESG